VNSLTVFKSNDPERTILCFRHQAPQGMATIRLTAPRCGSGHGRCGLTPAAPWWWHVTSTAGSMHPPSPEQDLVLAAIERFMADPDLVLDDQPGDGEAVDVLSAILRALTMVLPLGEIELAVTGLLTVHCDQLDDDTQLVLEALLTAIERDDDEMALDTLLASEASLLEANALDGNYLLVWDPADAAPLREMEILDVLERYPCRGEGARWSPDDFVALLEGKILQWRKTMVALEILQEHPGTRPAASTMVLLVPVDPAAPLEQLEVGVTLSPPPPESSAAASARSLPD
jgi:hypothetical protein